ncbi:hypothetical protein [Nitrosomonas sp.]|uniref:hypothetical protein n=1 Tax=Nitrosomonas sp. TaxID=42353 RepID=UPI002086DA11|nr:hypothetical protein [Nitrosomonas sp.]GJL76993.1 MAG: hypothetical protein NMNS02_30990 [Nitrosomonas sp.]
MTSEISETENAGFTHYLKLGLSKHTKKLPVNVREIEEELIWVLEKLFCKCKIIIIFDELDKLSDEKEMFESKLAHHSNPQEVINADSINELLSSLKSFITTAPATFFFISGRETLDKYYSEKGSPNSLYESLFDRVFEVPSLLSNQETASSGIQITRQIEEYVCTRLLPAAEIASIKIRILCLVDKLINCHCLRIRKASDIRNKILLEIGILSTKPSYGSESLREEIKSLVLALYRCRFLNKAYIYSKKSEIEDKLCKFQETTNYFSLKTYEKEICQKQITGNEQNKYIRQYISTLRDFIYYLTFHSWGNPKRLSSLFETFIVSKDQIPQHFFKPKEFEKIESPYWLLFNVNHLRSFSLAAELTGLFMHQLSREVSSISDKLTVSTFSAIHFILKFHSYGFRRSSLQRMSEAIGMYRSPEFNAIVNDLLVHTFNPYIRVVRNGLYRYRFYLGIEQELQYISHVSDLESVTYNSSLNSMRHVKQFYEDIITNCKNQEVNVISGVHVALGDICAIEQSYAEATVHYNIAEDMMLNLLNQDDPNDSSVHHDMLLQCVEVLLKQGDLEEHKQNFNNAAAIYFEAERIVKRLCNKDKQLKENLISGNLQWILLKQSFWARHFLSLKRSAFSFDHNPENRARITIPDYLYSQNDQNFYHTAASLYFFAGDVDLAKEHYETTIKKIDENRINQDEYDERVVFLKGNARIGIVENNLLSESRDYFRVLKDKDDNKVNTYLNKLFDFIFADLRSDGSTVKVLTKVAEDFEKNGLYVNATITYLKIINYYTAILDAFSYKYKNLTTDHTTLKHLTSSHP